MATSRPTFVILPADDVAFASHVRNLAADPEVAGWLDGSAHERFEARLREAFPKSTVRPREELALMRPDDPPVWYVSRGRERFRLHASAVVHAPPERVFETYVDPALLDRWLGATRIRPIKTSRRVVGTAWEAEFEILHITLAGRFRVTEAELPSRVRVDASGPLHSRLWYVTRFEPTTDGTAIDVEGDYQLPYELLGRVPSRLAAEREIERFVAASHERLKALIEGPEVPTSSNPKVG